MDLTNLLSSTAMPKSYTPVDLSYYKRPAPLSPLAEEPKVSLPSISSLLEGADGQHKTKRQRLSPTLGERHVRVQSYQLPPTPPLRSGSGHGNTHSRASSGSMKEHRHRFSILSNGSIQVAQPYASPASGFSSYTSPIDPLQHAIYYTRPIYQPSSPAPKSHSALTSPVTTAWQHRHYFLPSTVTQYQQKRDRHICRICHKAFSRPSSLRIHSHSHTGEKPFRCTQAGCGKAFSVRSNMKRHERGSHSGRPTPELIV